VIELDGSQHGEEEAQARDERRTRFLEHQGYTVVRFWNVELVENFEGVLHRIGAALGVLDPDWLDREPVGGAQSVSVSK
jgi:very-short-patch-repair endonuclease